MTPAQWGSKVTVFVTGAGPYTPSLDDGQVPPADTLHRLQLPVSVSFLGAGPSPEPGLILYAGPAPGFVGLAQIDFQLPPQPAAVLYRGVDILPILTIGSVSVYVPSIWLQ
jgi:uncharacterized protein (TIGR03437 family)